MDAKESWARSLCVAARGCVDVLCVAFLFSQATATRVRAYCLTKKISHVPLIKNDHG